MKGTLLFSSILVFTFLMLTSCSEGNTNEPISEKLKKVDREVQHVQSTEIQSIIDTSRVEGSVLIFDPVKNTFFSNNFDWAKTGRLPASTFKIPNSIISLELGLVQDDSTMFKWDGQKRMMKIWDRDMNFHDAFHLSCVPIYRQLARNIGTQQMKDHISKFNYGTMEIDSTNIDMFWLAGNSKISQFQQIDFLKRFNEKQLDISDSTYAIMKRMMIIENSNGVVLRGKTGWTQTEKGDNVWYVGFIESKGQTWYFATNLNATEKTNIDTLPELRKAITSSALTALKIP